ncbi:ATPase GET3B-like isoform X4 [Lycium barbarum]|uniref:ATPase GET3B-like isoform X4 n=1 Tax=Lycium barbarum TaxID=112863 RepID=UPI00293E5F5B|nr:ATPase GET3B-like isoform X4 [Lycium barbarum]
MFSSSASTFFFSSTKPMEVLGFAHSSHPLSLFNFTPTTFTSNTTFISLKKQAPIKRFQVRAVAAPAEATAGFDEMVSGTQRKYYMLGGKGGVGKTSCAASLAVKFANNGHPTLVVSTDPAHSLSDSFAQDLTGGTLVPVEGPYSPLFALELNPEKAKEEFRSATEMSGGSGIKDFMDGMGLGVLAEQLGELKLGELLDTPPPGLDEAIAISKVMQFLESQEYNMFTRVVFDTAPTGHTLRLLSLPDFLDKSIGKILKVMAISESSRLCASLKKEDVPVKRLIANQILPPSASDCKFCAMKRKDQSRALDMIQNDPELSSLMLVQAPLVDVEIRGVPALQFLGDIVWK